jgi:hypothetical protein
MNKQTVLRFTIVTTDPKSANPLNEKWTEITGTWGEATESLNRTKIENPQLRAWLICRS